MTARFAIQRLPYEPEWHVQMHATNGAVATQIDFYTQPEDLEPFASALTAFPRYQHDETSFEVGSDLGRWAYHIYLRAYMFAAVGHSALEILTDNRLAPPDHARVHFAIRCEPAALNVLGEQLLRWLKLPEEPVQWSTQVI